MNYVDEIINKIAILGKLSENNLRINPYYPTVIAWKYPTEPYQPKGE